MIEARVVAISQAAREDRRRGDVVVAQTVAHHQSDGRESRADRVGLHKHETSGLFRGRLDPKERECRPGACAVVVVEHESSTPSPSQSNRQESIESSRVESHNQRTHVHPGRNQ